MATRWYQEPALYEYLSTDTFWLIGIFIIANGVWTSRQIDWSDDKAKKSKNEPEAADASSENDSSGDRTLQPTVSHRHHISTSLHPHITSLPRKVLAITACSLVILAQLLEGWWVLRTTWRFTLAALKGTYPRWKPWVLGFVVYSPATAVILATWAGVLFTGELLVMMQLMYTSQLSELKPDSHLRLKADKNETGYDERGWEDVENTEEGKIS